MAIGVRADMYGKLVSHPELARAVAANQLPLGAMSEDELERAVTEPARLAGLRLEPGLVELVVREVAGEPGALPLLSHASARRLGAPRRTHPYCRGLPGDWRCSVGDRPYGRRVSPPCRQTGADLPAACSFGSPN